MPGFLCRARLLSRVVSVFPISSGRVGPYHLKIDILVHRLMHEIGVLGRHRRDFAVCVRVRVRVRLWHLLLGHEHGVRLRVPFGDVLDVCDG